MRKRGGGGERGYLHTSAFDPSIRFCSILNFYARKISDDFSRGAGTEKKMLEMNAQRKICVHTGPKEIIKQTFSSDSKIM